MPRPALQDLQPPPRGLSAALARGLALLLVAAVAAHAGDFAALSRCLARASGTDASAPRPWPLALARVVRGLVEVEIAREVVASRGPALGRPTKALPPTPVSSRVVLARDRVDLARLDLPPPARA